MGSTPGQIVGLFFDASGAGHGFLLSGGQYTTIDEPNAVGYTQALDINAAGQITGFYFDANSVFHGFLLAHGQYTTLDDSNAGTAVGQGTEGVGINASGKIVGVYVDANSVIHGFLAAPAHGDAPLGAAGGPASASGLDKASGTVNVLVAAAAMSSATSPGNPAVSAASSSGPNRGAALGAKSTGQTTAIVTVPSPIRGSGDSAGGRVSVLSAAAAAAGKHRAVTVDTVFATTDNLFGPITLI
jgi:hypothetical protein